MCADDEEEEGVFIERGKERAKKKGLTTTKKKGNPKFVWRNLCKKVEKKKVVVFIIRYSRWESVALHFFSSSSLLTKASDKSQNADEDEDEDEREREREREKFSFEERKEEEEEEEELNGL